MSKKTDVIEADVRKILDYNDVTTSIGIEDETGTLSINDIIDEHLEAAGRQVVLTAPLTMLELKAATITSIKTYCDVIDQPSDFLRYGYCTSKNWLHDVDWYCGASDPQYEQQYSPFKGIRASERKPLVAKVGQHFELFPSVGGSDKTQASLYYAAAPTLSGNDSDGYTLDIPDTLYDGFVYTLAALVAETLKDTEKSNAMMQVAKNMLTSADDVSTAAARQQSDNNE